MRTPLIVTAVAASLALAACGSTSTDAGDGSASPSASATSTPSASPSTGETLPDPTQTAPGPLPSSTPTVPPPADGDVPADLEQRPEVQAAMADAAGRAGIVPGDVVIGGYSRVTWNDGSLGCPKKGESYTQMTVEGELLLLRVDQRTMSYHAGRDGSFFYCAGPSGGYSPNSG